MPADVRLQHVDSRGDDQQYVVPAQKYAYLSENFGNAIGYNICVRTIFASTNKV